MWASVHAIRALGERMAKDGSITFISGMLSDRPNAHGSAVLAAASAAMEALARGLALELAPIRVNTLSPGPVATGIFDTIAATKEEAQAMLDGIGNYVPVKRVGSADEIAAAALYLASDESTYMVGAELLLDGGMRSL